MLSTYFDQITALIPSEVQVQLQGRLTRMVGLTLQAVGLQVTIGDRCVVDDGVNRIETEVVGFEGDQTFLMPLQPIIGIKSGATVTPIEQNNVLAIGDDLLGRVINGFGEPIDGKGPIQSRTHRSLQGEYINPLQRQPIREHLDVGIKAINAMLTVGRGQRLARAHD